MIGFMEKVRRSGYFETLRAIKVNVFWWLERQVLFHVPKLLPLAFRKPRFLYLELTNYCNLSCEMCIRGGGRKIGYMDFGLFKRLIDEAAKIGGVSLSFHFAGESTLHPRFADFLSYALKKKRRFYKLSLTTNGTAFNDEIARVALGLDWVTFSVDGVGEVSERIRKGSNYKVVERNILHFLELRGKDVMPIISTNTVISKQTSEELAEMYMAWKPRGVNVNYSGCIDDNFHIIANPAYAGYLNPKWSKKHSEPICYMPWSNLIVAYDGQVYFCCHNLKGFWPVGSVHTHSLMEIWRSQRLKEVREHLLKGIPQPGEICYTCKKR